MSARCSSGSASASRRRPAELEEFEALAASAGAIPVGFVTGARQRPDPRFFVGSGKAEELKTRAEQADAALILVDHPL